HVESLPPGLTVPLAGIGGVVRWIEALEGGAETVLATAAGTPVAVRAGALTYLGAWLDDAALDAFVARMAGAAGLSCTPLPGAVRRRETGVERFYFNYSAESTEIDGEEMPSTGVLRHPI
ncbi:MAG: beta-galactosidase, partial [Pseudomonadota bacterium]